MSSSLGSNLSELDRLLLELNAVQHRNWSHSFLTLRFPSLPAEDSVPAVPSCSTTHYAGQENGGGSLGKAGPPTKDKPKRSGGRGIEDVRPSVESLLDELESSVPNPTPTTSVVHSEVTDGQRDTPTQQQARISASSATRELDELMASLSDFKVQSNVSPQPRSGQNTQTHSVVHTHTHRSEARPAGAHTGRLQSPQDYLCVSPAAFTALGLRAVLQTVCVFSSLQCAFCRSSFFPSVFLTPSPFLSFLFSPLLLLLLFRSCTQPSSVGSLNSDSFLDTTDLLLTNTGAPKTTPKVTTPTCLTSNLPLTGLPWLVTAMSPQSRSQLATLAPESRDPSDPEVIIDVSATMLSSRLDSLVVLSEAPSSTLAPLCPATTDDPKGKSVDKKRPDSPPPSPEPSLDEALDRLLAMSCEPERVGEGGELKEPLQEVLEETVVAVERSAVCPDTRRVQKDQPEEREKESEREEVAVWSGPDCGCCEVHWNAMQRVLGVTWIDLSVSVHVCTCLLTTVSLPLILTGAFYCTFPVVIKSVIKRTKETTNVHPMIRDGQQRRKLGPIIFHKTRSQDRLIEELQGRLGIASRPERWTDRQDDWLTEGVIVMSKPARLGQEGRRDNQYSLLVLPSSIGSDPSIHLSIPTPSAAPGLMTMPFPPQRLAPSPVLWHDHTLSTCQPPTPPLERLLNPLLPDALLPDTSLPPSFSFPPLSFTPSPSQIMAQGKGAGGGGGSPTGAPKPGNKLDNMLGSLQSDLNRLGVQTVAKGVCGACKKPIAGQVVTAMGRTWHPEHFVCTHCQEEIGSRNFFERDGQPYCERDYHNLFSPRCHYCNGPILDKVVTALDRTWHPEHFFCAQCGAFFGPEGFHEKDGKAYCRKDYFDMFAPKCGGCARAILENYISALNALWHPECFVCRECFTPFVNGSFFEHDGQPYCEVHYHERRGSLCSGCQKPITGRCITAMARKFHPEHFVCAFCLKQLNKGTFKEQNDKPYCQSCFVKLFS
ncbi:PAXI protein, partial [Amia calva]|nr:PAXI protein [Amia calva]